MFFEGIFLTQSNQPVMAGRYEHRVSDANASRPPIFQCVRQLELCSGKWVAGMRSQIGASKNLRQVVVLTAPGHDGSVE
jgi:hypothetical protein